MSYLDKLKQFEQRPDDDPSVSSDAVTIDPATCRPVFWESNGKILGPGMVSHIREGDREWKRIVLVVRRLCRGVALDQL